LQTCESYKRLEERVLVEWLWRSGFKRKGEKGR
jgi:hypothetical protein